MPVDIDHNATTPFDSRLLETMMPHLTEHQAKISGTQRNGRLLRPAIGMAHQQRAGLGCVHPDQMIFMNDGIQTGNFATKGVAVPAAQSHQWRRVAGRAVV